MKVKVVRQSGHPVNLEDAKKFKEDFQSEYDKIQAEVGADMKAFHDELIKLDEKMANKYDTIVEWDLPKSGKKFKEIISKYGSVLVSTHKDTEELMLVIMDLGI